MKENTRKEIEAKWHQLIAKIDKTEKSKPCVKTAPLGAKVIRRRKGHMDLSIT